MPTISEELFENYCAVRGYRCARIQIDGVGRFPDYEIQTPRGPLICEIKEIVPNDEDKKNDEGLRKYGQWESSRKLGKRAYAALKSACRQLRPFENDPRPCMPILFDSTYSGHLSPNDIDAAMFGELVVLFPSDLTDRRLDFVHGGNRRLTGKRALYVGAVAVLSSGGFEAFLRLDIYHNNWFTSKRIWPAYFPDPRDRHFVKLVHPDKCRYEWYEYEGTRGDSFPEASGDRQNCG
jgi:hypothetical protein